MDEATGDPAIAAMNKDLATAMDVKHLASAQMAQRVAQKISGSGGYFYKLIGRFIDDYVFNPAITTRISQATKDIATGANVAQGAIRQGLRLGAIETEVAKQHISK